MLDLQRLIGADSRGPSGFIGSSERVVIVRPLGIVLAIVSGTLVLSFPYFQYGYSQVSTTLPSDVLIVAAVMMALAIGIAAIESWSQGEDADRMAKAAEAGATALSQLAYTSLNSARVPSPPTAPSATPQNPPAPPPGGVRYCPWCGAGNAPSSAYCNRCSRPLPAPS